MGIVQYIGAQSPHSETVNIAGYMQFIIDAVPAEVLTLPDAVCAFLVGSEPNWWQPSGGWTPPPAQPQTGLVAKVFSAYTVVWQNGLVLCDATSAPFIVTMLDVTTATQPVELKAIASNNNLVTIQGAGGQTIDGAASVQIGSASSGATYSAVTLRSDGANWRIV